MDKKAIQIMKDYVEGRMPIMEFKKEFDTNKKLKKLLNEYKRPTFFDNNLYGVYDYIVRQLSYLKGNWDSIWPRYVVWWDINDWLKHYNISVEPYMKYEDDHILILKIQPSWLDCVDDQGIFYKLIAEMPKDISHSKQIQWGKARIKELFRYDKSYPRWIQSPEWPIEDGKPLVFSHQSRVAKDDIRVHYHFYNPETGKEVIIEQFD